MASLKDQKEIITFMTRAGVNETEALLYLTLLQNGRMSVAKLAHYADVARTTAYENLQKLQDKDLVKKTENEVEAEPFEKMRVLLTEQQVEMEHRLNELQTLNADLQNVMHSLQESVSKDDSPISHTVYRGYEGVKTVYADSCDAKEVYSFVNIDHFLTVFPSREVKEMLDEAIFENPDRYVWDIAIDTPMARKNSITVVPERYMCRYVPDIAVPFGFDILIYEDKVSIFKLDPDDMYAVIIQSEPIALILKFIHKAMWPLMNV